MNEIIEIIHNSNNIVLLPHINADGDSYGSSLALCLGLTKIGKKVQILIEEEIPYVYRFLPGIYFIDKISDLNSVIKEYDLAIAIDSGDMQRLGRRAEIFQNAAINLNVDHHGTNTRFGQNNFIDTEASSVGEIIYELLNNMSIEIDKDISTCLYVSIISDTGSFRYSNTTAKTHHISGELINNGVDISDISHRVLDSITMEKAKLTGAALNSLELVQNGKIAILTIDDGLILKSGARDEDCEGLVDIGRNIRGVEVSVVFRFKGSDGVKINFRSNKYVDVSSIALEFGGGGHKRAAGCTIKGNLEEIKHNVLEKIVNSI